MEAGGQAAAAGEAEGGNRSHTRSMAAGASAGFDVRVGLEDVLLLPDGHIAADNTELVTAAVQLIGRPA